MRVLIKKELVNLFCSGTGIIFAFVFLLGCGLMLWLFSGKLNIPDNGYAALDNFFTLAPILSGLLIPALTMRLFAEEKRSGTILLLRSRPFSLSAIWFSKWLATVFFVTIVILSTTVYVYTLYISGSPTGNIDLHITTVSYLSLIGLVAVFTAVGLFASTLSGNQISAFVIALFINFLCYYGFDLIGSLFQSGKLQTTVSSLGLSFHMSQIQRGVVELTDILDLAAYIVFFWILSIWALESRKKLSKKHFTIAIICIAVICISHLFLPLIRFDFTQDKRYTISDYSKKLLSETEKKDIQVNVYLTGNLNAGFQRLQNAIKDFLYDLNRYANQSIIVSFIDPASINIPREKLAEYMAQQGMQGILLNEVDRDGKLSQQLIYPYAQVISGKDTLLINLLKNVQGNTAEENLNASAENLEFQFVDALRLLLRNEEKNIAFIEGHGELERAYIYDAEEALAKYFYVNRGQIGNDISILNNFDVVIIAGPTRRFSETEKFILDQYIMQGGSVLWLIDGAYVSTDDLRNNGQSASIKNETNLDDLLFTYGVRIEPNLIQDSQSSQILVNTGTESSPVVIPWYYAPLLLSSPDNIITKGIGEIKSEFVSSISLLKNSETLERSILLTTSTNSHIVQVPEMIDFDIRKIQSDPAYFNNSFLLTSVALKGQFRSAFENRILPDSIDISGYSPIYAGKPAKMIVASTSSIIRNEIIGQGDQTQVLPMGYDRISKRTFGNREFIVNAVNWLANDDEWMQLKNKSRNLQLLNRQMISENRMKYTLLNILFPLLLISIIIGSVNIRRRYKYKK